MTSLFDFAFARLDHSGVKRADFVPAWADYIAGHPWEMSLTEVANRTFEITVRVCEPALPAVSLAFSDWSDGPESHLNLRVVGLALSD